MAIDRNPHLTVPVKTYSHYTECEPWCQVNIGVWNETWWRDFPDMAMSIALGEVLQSDCYWFAWQTNNWFAQERDATIFRLKFK